MPFTRGFHPTRMAKIFVDPHAFTSTLIVALLDLFPEQDPDGKGPAVFKWSPETIAMELEAETGAKIPSVIMDRIMAGIAILTTDRFFKSTDDFIELCTILSGAEATPGTWCPADADDCAWGLTEALLLAPPPDNDPAPFSDDIRGYITEVLKSEGIITPPDILKLALPDEETLGRVQSGFADDQVMSEAIWQTESSKTEDINTLVRERLMRLIEQLQSLDLEHGQVDDIAKKLLSTLKQQPQGGSPL